MSEAAEIYKGHGGECVYTIICVLKRGEAVQRGTLLEVKKKNFQKK